MSGCGPGIYELTNIAPQSSSKGYAMFYCEDPKYVFGSVYGLSSNGIYVAKVYSSDNKIVGYVNRNANWQIKSFPMWLIISNTPGDYDYLLKIGPNNHTVKFAIKEDSLTLVNLAFANWKPVQTGYLANKVSYDLSVTSKTFPYTTEEGINNLIKDLNNEYWENRWLSTYLLGNIKEPRAYDPIKEKTNDYDKRVRFLSRKVLRQYN